MKLKTFSLVFVAPYELSPNFFLHFNSKGFCHFTYLLYLPSTSLHHPTLPWTSLTPAYLASYLLYTSLPAEVISLCQRTWLATCIVPACLVRYLFCTIQPSQVLYLLCAGPLDQNLLCASLLGHNLLYASLAGQVHPLCQPTWLGSSFVSAYLASTCFSPAYLARERLYQQPTWPGTSFALAYMASYIINVWVQLHSCMHLPPCNF